MIHVEAQVDRPWQEIEKELLEQERERQRTIIRSWVIGGISRGIFFAILSTIVLILMWIFLGIYIRLEFVLFMESGLFFLIGGMVGTHKTSITLNNVLNTIFGTNFKQDGKES